MQSLSPSSSFSYGFTYQVFLSIRGTDTRHGFTGNLYKALTDKGIHTFIDDNDLQRGDEITPSILKAIEESRIFIPVFSINYASSSFCLDELVHIIHFYKEKGRLVLPVFYGVDPSHVRHHRGSYGEALAKHKKRFKNNTDNMKRLQKWKIALTQAANLSSNYFQNGYEYETIGKIVEDISNKINREPLHVAKYPVGLESQAQQVKSLLDNGSDDRVHMVGIYGIGGLGKSTLARAIYNFVADQFDGLCFLHDVRENSAKNNLKHLQEKLLLKTTGLEIKLGDVSEGISIIKQRLCRKKILLILDDVDKLDQLEALAGGLDWFGRGSRVIITTRDKHLLAYHGIEKTYAVEGLYGTEALELLRWMAFKSDKVPSGYEDILNRAVAYASSLPLVIEVVGSNLFGKSIEEWKYTLDGYDRIPNQEIQKILKVSYDALEEEEQSVFLDIVCCFKGYKWPKVKEILHAHYGHSIVHHVEVLAEKSLMDHLKYDSYVTLHDLIEDMGKEVVRQESPNEPGERSRLWYDNDMVHVLKKRNAFSSDTLFRGKSQQKLENMKVLILNNCQHLIYIPDFSGLPNLEKFSFVRCHNLVTIHNSIGYLNKIKILNAEGCQNLESFPPLRSPSLQNLELSNCKSLKSFPELLCKMTNIKSIWLEETSIGEFPLSFQNLSELTHLTISGDNLKMNLLKILRLDGCKCFEENRGIPLNPEKFSGFQCKSGHKSKGHTISFLSRKKIPYRTIIIILLCLSMGINILFLTKHFAVWETRA